MTEQLTLDFRARKPGAFHYAKLESSPRLRRLLAYLRERGAAGCTTRDIVMETGLVAVSAAAAEIRANGFDVQCEREGRTEGGAVVYRYRLVEDAP